MDDRTRAMQECLREINEQVRRIETHPMNQGMLASFVNGGQAHYAILQLRTVASRIKAKIEEDGRE